ncbi:hypothetical protein LRC484719_48640 [Mycobacterium riyadhense]
MPPVAERMSNLLAIRASWAGRAGEAQQLAAVAAVTALTTGPDGHKGRSDGPAGPTGTPVPAVTDQLGITTVATDPAVASHCRRSGEAEEVPAVPAVSAGPSIAV